MPDDQSYSLPPTQSASLEVGQRVFRHYVLNRFLGRGALGAAWLVVHEGHGRELAMRFVPEAWLRDERAMAALREAVVKLLDITHPNIVGVLDFVRDPQAAAIVARFVDGKTLHERRGAAEERFLPVSVLQAWLAQLCEALDFAWRRHNAIHGDLCPQNMLVTDADEFRILDFGLARSLYDLPGPTGAPLITGTQAYLSPERARGLSIAVTDDVYGFGATVYELLTSRPVFFRGNVLWQLESVVPPSMTERRAEFGLAGESIPPEWEQVIAACLAKRREDRPRDLREVGERLGLLHPLTATEDTPVPVVLPRSPDLNAPSSGVYSLRSEHPAPEFPSSLQTVSVESMAQSRHEPDLEVTQDANPPIAATTSTQSSVPEDESDQTVAATEPPPPKTPPAAEIEIAPVPSSPPTAPIPPVESTPPSATRKPPPPPPPSARATTKKVNIEAEPPTAPPRAASTQSPIPEDESDQTVAATEPPPPKAPPAAEVDIAPVPSAPPPLPVPPVESAPPSATRKPPPPPPSARATTKKVNVEAEPPTASTRAAIPEDESDQTVAATEPPPPKTPPAAEIEATPVPSAPPPLPVPPVESAPPTRKPPPPPPPSARTTTKKVNAEAEPPTTAPSRPTPPPPPTEPGPIGPVSTPLKWIIPTVAIVAILIIGAVIFALKPKGRSPSTKPTPGPTPIASTPPTPEPVKPTPTPSGVKEVTIGDLLPLANQGIKDRLMLTGEFRVSSAGGGAVIARPTAKDLTGAVRVSARFPQGAQLPAEGSTVTWSKDSGLIVRGVRMGNDGQLNIEVEKER